MKTTDLAKKDIDLSLFYKRLAKEKDCSLMIGGETLIRIDGVPKILLAKVPSGVSMSSVRSAALRIKASKVKRISKGLITGGKNRIFGYRPQRAMSFGSPTCAKASLAAEDADADMALCEFAEALSPLYKHFFPHEYESNLEVARGKISKDWIIGDTPFTSGIVNVSSQLPYHYDIGHFSKSLSIMLVLKDGCHGGNLCLPEIDANLQLEDGYVLIFDGQELLHGVTPILKMKEGAYRTTIVWYTLQSMWRCLTYSEEIEKGRKMRMKRETKRLSRKDGNDLVKDEDKDKNLAVTKKMAMR